MHILLMIFEGQHGLAGHVQACSTLGQLTGCLCVLHCIPCALLAHPAPVSSLGRPFSAQAMQRLRCTCKSHNTSQEGSTWVKGDLQHRAVAADVREIAGVVVLERLRDVA